jgi:LytR cell envelope-related transcriptional attenuator
MRTMLDRAQAKFGSMDLKAVNSLVSSTADNLSLDSKLSIGDLVSLGKSFKGFSGNQIVTHALPVYLDMTSGGASILRLDTAAAEDVLNIFRGVPAGTVTSKSVILSVTNATGTKGRAVDVAARLKQLGFTATSGGDISKSQTSTSIRYLPGFEKQADLLRRQLGGTSEMQSDKTLKSSAPVVLILGSSFTGVLAEPAPASSTTTTSASGSLTSTTTGPVTTVKPGEVTELVGIQAGKAPEGVVCK